MNNITNYLSVFRPQQWYKNFVVIFGFVAALAFFQIELRLIHLLILTLVYFLLSLISSANYGVNEIVDKEGDSHHPLKNKRSVVSGKVNIKILWILIIIIILFSLGISFYLLNIGITITLLLLFIAGILYNIRPFRFKDVAYIDVISESINNPIRVLAGWFIFADINTIPPLSFLLFFLISGIILMSYKRFKELKYITQSHPNIDPGKYRKSYNIYDVNKLIKMTVLYFLICILLFIYFIFTYIYG